jgi:hypothetical protein
MLKPIQAVALDNDLGAILERTIAGIRVDGRRSAANRVAGRVLAASTGTNSRAYWNFESSPLQRRVVRTIGSSAVEPDAERDGGTSRIETQVRGPLKQWGNGNLRFGAGRRLSQAEMRTGAKVQVT